MASGGCHNEALRPISTLRTRIVAIKHLAAGETVGSTDGHLTRPTHHGDDPRGLCRRAGPPPGLRPLVGAGRRRGGAHRGARLHGQLHDRHYGYSGRGGGRRGADLSPEPGNDLETMAGCSIRSPYEIMTSVSSRVKRIYLKGVMAYGTLYLIPCPISDETAPWEVLPASNPRGDGRAGLLHRREYPLGAAVSSPGRHRADDRRVGVPRAERTDRRAAPSRS